MHDVEEQSLWPVTGKLQPIAETLFTAAARKPPRAAPTAGAMR